MEKSQYSLCVEILKRLNAAGVLNELILIGSWCIPFYKEYFQGTRYTSSIRTRDIDFLVSSPNKIKVNVNIPELLKDLGFIIGFRGEKGYIQLEHPQLIIEFLVPEKGKGVDKPVSLPKLNINATALRFLELLTKNVIKVKIEGISVTLPHPANFALHKLIVFQRRLKQEKVIKDIDTAIALLKALIDKGEGDVIKDVFNSMHYKWQNRIIRGLEKAKEKEILDILTDRVNI